jgi:hypothetical protein
MDMTNKTIKINHLSVDYVKEKTICEVSVYQVISEGIHKKVLDLSLEVNSSFQDANDDRLTLKILEIIGGLDVPTG